MKDQYKNMMIGLFVLAALGIIIFIMLFLHPNVGNEAKILRVRFADIDKITPGTRVTFGGKPVGEVLEVQEIKTENGARIERDGVVYVYELSLGIDSSVVVDVTDEITARTSGLLGERSVAISPVAGKRGEKLVPVKGEILYSAETGSVESTLREFKKLSGLLDVTLNGVNDALAKLRERHVWENVGTAVESLAEVAIAMNQPEKIHAIFDNGEMMMQNLEEITTALNDPKKITSLLDNVVSVSERVNTVVMDIQSGKGTVGSLLVKDDFYLRLTSLLNKGEVVLNDINHYGVLFHLDKGWQRLRARRLNLLQTLSNPQEFRNYFNDELDKVTTALERVSMVIEESSENCGCSLWDSPEYLKVYAELLRRVAMLEEYLQLYNQQVVQCVVQETEL